MPDRGLTLGTAGHIDHGKSALVEALTGTNADRLVEERRRGISIELGFAELELAGGRKLSVVDVPGHERFVRTMVAGATGIDLFLLVVAADDGPMPQTYEHTAVMRALGVERGVVAISKCDLVPKDRLASVTEDMLALLPSIPCVAVSARTGEGLEDLRRLLGTLAADTEFEAVGSDWPEPAILHVDRSFTLKGIGTVLTGTLRSGSIAVGDRVAILPRRVEARVRSIHTHNRSVRATGPGRRVALNLAGISRGEVKRGDVVAPLGTHLSQSYRIDVALELRPGTGSLDGKRVQVHHGTRYAAARLIGLGSELAQLRLETPFVARSGDRIVIRSVAPPDTLGGGIVIDPCPRRHGASGAERLRKMIEGGPAELLAAAFSDRPTELERDPSDWLMDPLIGPTLRRFPTDRWRHAATQVRRDIPLPSPPQVEPTTAHPGKAALATRALLVADGPRPRSPQAVAEALGIPRREALDALEELVASEQAVRAKPGVYFSAVAIAGIREKILTLAGPAGSISVAELRDALATSRRHAQALLEHFDGEKLTIRHGDRHVVRRHV